MESNADGVRSASDSAQRRHVSFSYAALPLVGKISLAESTRLVVGTLKPGTWLDLLCGRRALLQSGQAANPRFSGMYALDLTLDPTLATRGFHLTEWAINRTLPYPDTVFDNVTLVNGLEHLWFPQEVLTECNRVLATDGILQVIVPTWFGKRFLEFLAFKIGNPQASIEMDDHKLYYDERTLWPMLIRAGFVPRHIQLRRVKLFCSLYACARKGPPGPVR